MVIANSDQLINALGNGPSRIVIDKATLANQAVGGFTSLWRATGQPAQAAIPGTTPAVPTHATLGAVGFAQQTSPATSYIGWLSLSCSNAAMTAEVHDRVAHSGGLSLAVSPAAQTITGFDVGSGGLNLAADRRGDANYSDLQWWLEVYADGGATASNATINVTYGDNSTGNLTVLAVGGTLRAARMFPLTPLIPGADQGKFIRAINSVTLSASTGTAGNFGFTCTRPRTTVPLLQASFAQVADFSVLGLPEVPNNSCLQLIMLSGQTSSGSVRGTGKIIHG